MATATMKIVTPPVQAVKVVVLELIEQEALVVRALVGSVQGGGKTRELTDGIYNAFVQAGVERDYAAYTDLFTSDSRLQARE